MTIAPLESSEGRGGGGRLNPFAFVALLPGSGPVSAVNEMTVGGSLGLRLSLAASLISFARTHRFCEESGRMVWILGLSAESAGWCQSSEPSQKFGK